MTGRSATRVLEAVFVAALWAAVVLGSSVLALTVPVYTSALTQALGVPSSAGLPAADVVKLSGQVRALVADKEYDPLPTTWKGQPAFDAAAVQHLLDVRHVIQGARLAVGVCALLLAVFLSVYIARRRFDVLADGMLYGAAILTGGMAVAVVAALTSFDALFAAFHGLFFASGTWTFPADSLLIRLFPERFWMVSGAAWAGLTVAGAAVLSVTARLLRERRVHENASPSANNV